MADTYHECACQSGKGMYVRMKDCMLEGVADNKDQMFTNVHHEVTASITGGLDKVTAEALIELDVLWKAFRNDCARFLSKVPTGFTVLAPEIQLQIRQVLDEADILFGSQYGQPIRLLTSAADADSDDALFIPSEES